MFVELIDLEETVLTLHTANGLKPHFDVVYRLILKAWICLAE